MIMQDREPVQVREWPSGEVFCWNGPHCRNKRPSTIPGNRRHSVSGQGQFFYSFRLDEAVPGDHSVRDIEAVIAIASQAACGQSLRPKDCKTLAEKPTPWRLTTINSQ
jgi:hypothetical protein